MAVIAALVSLGLLQSAFTLQAQLVEPVAGPYNHFGVGVAIDGGTLAIGSYDSEPGPIYHGAVYVYRGHGANWTYEAEVHDPTPTTQQDDFGYAIAVQGDELFVGAHSDATF